MRAHRSQIRSHGRGRGSGSIALLLLLAGLAPGARAATSSGAQGVGRPPVSAPGYQARYLVPPNPLPATNGLRLDGAGHLFVAQAFLDRISRINLADGTVTRVADDTDSVPVEAPDDLALGPDGLLYVTEFGGGGVVRMRPDGTERTRIIDSMPPTVVGGFNGIEFNTQGRLFVTDLTFDPARPGGLWEIDPAGSFAPIPVARSIGNLEGFAFGPDGLAYIPDFYNGTISAVDVDRHTVRVVVAGLGVLAALEVDADGALIVLESDTGRVLKVDAVSGVFTEIARGEPGLDNLAIDGAGTIYVSNFVRGDVRRVDQTRGVLLAIGPDAPLSIPVSVTPAADGSLIVADTTSVVRLDDQGRVDRLGRIFIDTTPPTDVDGIEFITTGAVQLGPHLYFSDFMPLLTGRIVELDIATGTRRVIADGFQSPWTVREGAAGHLLVADQALGAVVDVDPATGLVTPVIGGLSRPAGLAYAPTGVVYVSESGGGRVVAVNVVTRASTVVADALDTPEGVAMCGPACLLVVEAGTGRLVRVDLVAHTQTVVAAGLPTKLRGLVTAWPWDSSADVAVRPDGAIVVTGPANASVIELRPQHR